MKKLMHWAMKCGQSSPNLSAVSLAFWPRSLAMLPKRIKCVIIIQERPARSFGSAPAELSFGDEERVKHDGLGEGHPDQPDRDDLAERAGISSHRFGSLHADQS